MPKVQDIINTALNEVGTTEYPPNSNKCKYNREFYGHDVQDGIPTKKDKYPWCCVFVWWVFSRFNPCLVKKTASCMNMAQWFKDNGRWIEPGDQRPGDVAFYKFSNNDRWTDHTGITVEVFGKNDINALEGNTSVGNDCNGGSVRIRHRTSGIVGYGRPAYDEEAAPVDPDDGTVYGMDVNEAQGVIDFDQVKASGIKFVCMRSTRKSGKTDAYFERNLAECINKGLDYSCFKYAYAKTHEGARLEADGVINLLAGRKMTIWYDLEDDTLIPLGKDGIEGITMSFLGECKDAGYDVGIYTGQNWYDKYISDYLKEKFNFWIARYGPNNGKLNKDYPVKAKNLVAWQYTSRGKVPGINAYVDLDVLC